MGSDLFEDHTLALPQVTQEGVYDVLLSYFLRYDTNCGGLTYIQRTYVHEFAGTTVDFLGFVLF